MSSQLAHRITVFSVPYYSGLSLLPSDPSPFTLPNTPLKRSDQPPITLASYPLPDGDWHWVSRCWMVDMRTDSAEVQHDGFEYNWMFRKNNWSPRVGPCNAHGWVRRRRWIRLMVRPAKKRDYDGFNTPDSSAWTRPQSFIPPSLLTSGTDTTQMEQANVWLGDPEGDWQRCLAVMKLFGRDGRKLELWKLWLGYYDPDQFPLGANTKGKQPEGEIEKPLPSAIFPVDVLSPDSVPVAAREHVMAVLRHHVTLLKTLLGQCTHILFKVQHLLHLFIYPESRVCFLKLLSEVGLWSELNNCLGTQSESTEIDFLSYVNGLENGEVLNSKTENSSVFHVDES